MAEGRIPGRHYVKGSPPEDHPRRCIHRNSIGGRCNRWAAKNVQPPKCRIHGANNELRARRKEQLLGQKIGRLHPVYRNLLSPRLRELIDSELERDPDEQTEIFEELALTRTYACEFVKLYNSAVEVAAQSPTPDNGARVFATGNAMSEALSKVADLADRACRINVKQKNRFSLADVRYIVDSIVLIIHSACEGDITVATKIAECIKRDLELPLGYGEQAAGTLLHPADTVAQQYDDLVPTKPLLAEEAEEEDDDQHNAEAH